MFFTRYVAALGAEWEELLPSLDEPAKHGRYHAFASYPLRDYVRVFDRVARARFPGSTREAFRLLARGEVEVFSESTLGKVTFSLLGIPRRRCCASRTLQDGGARLGVHREARRPSSRFRDVPAHLRRIRASARARGRLVQTYDEEPRLEVLIDDHRRIEFDVSW